MPPSRGSPRSSPTATINQDRPEELCRTHDIALLRLSGSAARDEEDGESDVDLLVELTTRKSLLDLVRAERELAELVGRPEDLVTENGLSPYLHHRVLQTARVLYERAG